MPRSPSREGGQGARRRARLLAQGHPAWLGQQHVAGFTDLAKPRGPEDTGHQRCPCGARRGWGTTKPPAGHRLWGCGLCLRGQQAAASPAFQGPEGSLGTSCVRHELLAPGPSQCRLGEEGPEEGLPATVLPSGSAGEAGLPRTERTPCGWERQDILSSAWGNSALPWRWGGCRLRPWHLCTQQEACSY